MKLRVKTGLILLLLLSSYSFGQIEQYNYKREINGITGQWHKIVLPDDIFRKVSPSLSDIRIFGITTHNDTLEAPYLLRTTVEKISSKEVAFKILNTSLNDKGHYFTFEIPTKETINQIKLEFKQQNFDWRLKLEGSQNQQKWFTVIENYRILSIKNELTDFQFTKLTFPNSKYRFFRLHIDSKAKPELSVATIVQHDIIDGTLRDYPVSKINVKENIQARQTEIDIALELPVPVSYIKVGVLDTLDYYRPVTIKALTDSFETEQGWNYIFKTLISGTLNSLGENEFRFNGRTIKKIKIFIQNHDNRPLAIDTFRIGGYVHELVARFTEEANYFLTYGNRKIGIPQYDIGRFTDNIPNTLTPLTLGIEQKIEKDEIPGTDPLFKNKIWLWLIIIGIILLLGWFSIKMIRHK